MAPRTIPTLIVALLATMAFAACGGSGKKYYIPVDSPDFKPFEPPTAEDFEEDDDNWDDADDDDDGDDADDDDDDDGGATMENVGSGTKKPATSGGGAVKADIKLGKASVSAGLSKDSIAKVIRGKHLHFKTCYERELMRDPKLTGIVRVGFVIKPDGSVADVASSGLAVVDACVGKIIASLAFPKPRSKVRVTYPFVFSSK